MRHALHKSGDQAAKVFYLPHGSNALQFREVLESKVAMPSDMRDIPKPIAGYFGGRVDAIIGYDGSHVLGLIAGGQFQKPLAEVLGALFGQSQRGRIPPGHLLFETLQAERLQVHRLDAHLTAGVDHAEGNLATVCNKHFFEHLQISPIFKLGKSKARDI
jgi:hypothetical protein